MLNTIYIIQLDNYYDRTVHPYYSELDDGGLGLYLEFDTYRITNFNFVPNDGVNTTVLLNLDTWQFGNYFLVVDQDNKIVSRWFIIDTVRTRGGQYQLTLRRDVITDYWNIIKQSPALIEKCNLDYDNPLIFNNEDMTVNQIKTKETLLKDKSGCPWLVAYIAKDAGAFDGTAKVGSDLESSAIAINDTIENWQADKLKFYGDYQKLNYKIYCNGLMKVFQVDAFSGAASYKPNAWGRDNTTLDTSDRFVLNSSYENGLKNGFKAVGLDYIRGFVPAYTPERHTANETEEFLELNGKTIRDINGRVFNVSITQIKQESVSHDITSGNLFNVLGNAISQSKAKAINGEMINTFKGTPNSNTFSVTATYNTYSLTLAELYSATISYEVPDTRIATEDAPYDILAIPYGTILAEAEDDDIATKAEIGLAVTQAIAKNLDAACYDIQLVPYCPIQSYIIEDGVINTVNMSGLTSYIVQGDTKVGVIYHVPKANFTFNLLDSVDCAKIAIERKINNDCDKWRLASPNYSNYFDFSVEKNNGIQYFNVDCTYKPYSPYIHVNPNFNGLYGQDFNDPRGLVLGGDFSLGQVRSAWESYQLQNKNFQETFDRQIQNMEFNNKMGRISDIVGASVGTVSGGMAGATTGLVASGGNPYVAAASGIGGGLVSAGGGMADIAINEALRNETLDYTKDLFGYNLGNIKAIPLTLSKISAFNENNKVFPVLEYYTCTDTEKEAYVNKIAYNGMTAMMISTINDASGLNWEYEINNKTIKSQNYIKARIIRTSLENEGFQIANAIADEVNKGFYIIEE